MTKDKPVTIIGIGMDRFGSLGDSAGFSGHPDVIRADAVIASSAVLDAMGPVAAKKIPVRTPVSGLLDEAAALLDKGCAVTVLAGGDPLFFSIGVSFVERFGPERVRILPGVSSLQAAAAKFGIPWGDVRTVSAHGRKGFLALCHAVMQGGAVCLLTDETNSPDSAARFLTRRGVTNYTAHIAANLGNETESLWSGMLGDAVDRSFPGPNVMFLLPDPSLPAPAPLCPGQPESAFAHEGGLITKWPVRAAILASLRIEPRHVVWDLGSGSGSVAIEAASLARQGQVVAVEREAERVAHIEENRRRFGAANLDILHASMPGCLEEAATEALPRPDRIFIGGGLGGNAEKAGKTIRLCWERLLPGGRLVAACVLLDSLALARDLFRTLDVEAETTMIQASAAAKLGNDAHLQPLNPVFCLVARKIA